MIPIFPPCGLLALRRPVHDHRLDPPWRSVRRRPQKQMLGPWWRISFQFLFLVQIYTSPRKASHKCTHVPDSHLCVLVDSLGCGVPRWAVVASNEPHHGGGIMSMIVVARMHLIRTIMIPCIKI